MLEFRPIQSGIIETSFEGVYFYFIRILIVLIEVRRGLKTTHE